MRREDKYCLKIVGEKDIIQVDETETISIAGAIYMKKKMWLTLCNLGVSVVFLLSLYSYTKGMRMFSLGLVMALLIELGIRGFIEQKFAQEAAEVNGNKIYYVSEILRYACAIILAIAVWRNGFK